VLTGTRLESGGQEDGGGMGVGLAHMDKNTRLK
jgi:hypothetical protein